MTKSAALQAFFSGFGLNAWPETSVPTGAEAPDFPYITYEGSTTADFDEIEVSASLWYRETSWKRINAKAEEISSAIDGCYILRCDDGAILVRRGNPFSQNIDDPSDNIIKHKILTFEMKFVTIH